LPDSVFPSCAPATNTTRVIGDVALRSSIMDLKYGVLDVRHGPASELAIGLSILYWSAHSETVR
jgi:hypothetical protein